MTEEKQGFVVTIDGPAASGKSTTARLVALELGWLYLDTGAMYRALTVKVLRGKVSLDDTEKIGRMAEKTEVELVPSDDGVRVFLDGEDVTADIRQPNVDRAVGPVCEIARVRQVMVSLQRKMGEGGNIVAEGRDMGTVVFPDADLKFFMKASLEERAERRQRDMIRQGIDVSKERLMEEIERRDQRDSSRQNSPLIKAEDAFLIDTTRMDVKGQVAFVIDRIHQKMTTREKQRELQDDRHC
jgi:cytidylate kinase